MHALGAARPALERGARVGAVPVGSHAPDVHRTVAVLASLEPSRADAVAVLLQDVGGVAEPLVGARQLRFVGQTALAGSRRSADGRVGVDVAAAGELEERAEALAVPLDARAQREAPVGSRRDDDAGARSEPVLHLAGATVGHHHVCAHAAAAFARLWR